MLVKKWFGPNLICLSSKRRNKDSGQELYVLRVQYWHMKKPHFQQVTKSPHPNDRKETVSNGQQENPINQGEVQFGFRNVDP